MTNKRKFDSNSSAFAEVKSSKTEGNVAQNQGISNSEAKPAQNSTEIKSSHGIDDVVYAEQTFIPISEKIDEPKKRNISNSPVVIPTLAFPTAFFDMPDAKVRTDLTQLSTKSQQNKPEVTTTAAVDTTKERVNPRLAFKAAMARRALQNQDKTNEPTGHNL